MTTLYITEYANNPNSGQTMYPAEPANATQTVALSGSSASSNAFATNTTMVRLESDSVCSVIFGTSPTATTSHPRMAAGAYEYRYVPQGQSYKVAAITNT